MGMKDLEKQIALTNKLLLDLIVVTKKTKDTLTMVNVINTITLVVIVVLMTRGLL